jgi:hypothetical protein
MQTVVDGVVVVLEDVLPGRAPIESYDRPENLVDALQYSTLEDMERAGLMSASLDETPWSDDYWAIYRGILGYRYADPGFPGSSNWEVNFDYVQDNPAHQIAAGGDRGAIDNLSPSEKYDLLVGDQGGTLTAAMWNEGKKYYDASGRVEAWMGICHGWAPAAYMIPRPQKTVEVVTPGGLVLRFYPSDIKALASLLWAKSNTVSKLIGGRCNDKDPELDSESGRNISPRCFDTNPGAWHLAIVNQIGGARRSMIMDATFDYEVWNQPISAYEYFYFNPAEMAEVASIDEARVQFASFSHDRFRKFRKLPIESLVGVVMRVRYVVETSPSHDESDDPSRDATSDVYYVYDLELDASGKITGGEWYTNRHPDFLWTPPPSARAWTPADQLAIGEWLGGEAVPPVWRRAARRASDYAMPLAKVVEELVRRSRT